MPSPGLPDSLQCFKTIHNGASRWLSVCNSYAKDLAMPCPLLSQCSGGEEPSPSVTVEHADVLCSCICFALVFFLKSVENRKMNIPPVR